MAAWTGSACHDRKALAVKGAQCVLLLCFIAGWPVLPGTAQLTPLPPSVPASQLWVRPDASWEAIGERAETEPQVPLVWVDAPASLLQPGWTWQLLPEGLLYRSYLAGGREPRLAVHFVHVEGDGWLGDLTLGARIGLLRYGSLDPRKPEGWQFDVEVAAFPRVRLDWERDMISADFRYGFPLTYRRGRWEGKLAYYHLSSHLADEYLEDYPEATRINFSRDAVVLGVAHRPHEDLRLYVEAGWAFYTDGGSEPWEFQFGVDYAPARPWGFWGSPFVAINGRIREEVDFGGNLTAQAGLQWRNHAGRLVRAGLQYFNGKSDQYEFFRQHEQQIGFGIWYDY